MKPTVPFYAKVSIILIGLFTFLSMLYLAQTIIVPVIYSVLMAIVLSPVVDFFVRKKMNRVLAISISLIFVILATLLVLTFLSSQLVQFSDSFPKILVKFDQLTKEAVAWTSESFNISPGKINAWLVEKRSELLNGSTAAIGQTLINTGNVLVVLVLIPVYVFMILYYQPLLLDFIHKVFKSDNQTQVGEVLSETKNIVKSYLVGLLLEAAIVATLNSVSLLIIGIQYAVLLGVISAILNLIPYLGGIIAAGLSVMVTLATEESFSLCLMVFASFVIIQLIDNNFIIPKIVASKVKINALVSIIVVLAGGALWGIPGMFLSIPLTAIIKVICDHLEPLKPWGYLLGDTMPPILGINAGKKKAKTKQIQLIKTNRK